MKKISILLILSIILISCYNEEGSTPKPKTYFRIDTPNPNYTLFKTNSYPYEFEYPDYGFIEKLENRKGAMHWLNISFPQYGCKLYLSYKEIGKEARLDKLINDSYTFLEEHQKLSSGIIEREYYNQEKNISGYTFEIKGKEIASPYQFYLTDSLNHFVRGAIYFDFKTNNDSLSPVIERLTKDLDYLISTFDWN